MSRIRLRQEALQIFEAKGVVAKWNATGQSNGFVTSQGKFWKEIKNVRDTVQHYQDANVEKDRPLVIAIFGAPGSGKSYLAEKLTESSGKEVDFITANLSALEGPSQLFELLLVRLQKELAKRRVVFLDEFDVERHEGSWYQWLLTLLWDGEIPTNGGMDHRERENMVVCLAASRYEQFADFQEFAFSERGTEEKAPDVLSRIDAYLDVPPLLPRDRALVMSACSNGVATEDLLALCYVAELEDNARGIQKLLKGVDVKKAQRVGLSDLLPAARRKLNKAAGLKAS